MKRTALMIACALVAAAAWAGVRNIQSSEVLQSNAAVSDVSGPESWTGAVRRVDGGSLVALKNLGDRFASVLLRRGESVEVCMSIPGLPTNERIQLASTHGGTIDGHSRVAWAVQEDGRVCFPYTLGVMGPHPVIVTVRGRSMTLLFQVEEEVVPKEQREAAAEDAR